MSDQQRDWLQLQRAALLGTEREGVPNTALSSVTTNESAEDQLLLGIGMTDFYQQVGRAPLTIEQSAYTNDDSSAVASSALSNYLSTMLDGRYRDLLPELLQTLIDTEQTLPRELLPNLLRNGDTNQQQRHLIFQSIGSAGHQLASLRPDWHYAAGDIYEWDRARAIWQHQKPAKRQAFLRQLRHLNPSFARELLMSSWKAEPQQQRLWFIRLLSINLSLEDESFLEMALDDRMLAVRREAVKLLTMLPDSKLCQRVTKATRLVLTWSRTAQHLVVRFPVGVSRLLQRDGVPVQAKPKSLARLRGEQLRAMVLAVPLDTWTTRFGVSAETILTSLPESKWPRTLLKAFTDATLRQQNQTWALALLRREIKTATAKLFGVLSAETQASLLAELASTHPQSLVLKDDPMQLLLYQHNAPWSAAIAATWLRRVKRHFEQANKAEPNAVHSELRNPLFINTIRKMARLAPIELADDIVATLQPFSNNPIWRSKLHDIIGLVRFRQRMLKAAQRDAT